MSTDVAGTDDALDDSVRRAYAQALKLLVRREHSQVELLAKLCQRGYSEAAASAAIGDLRLAGYQSDERFAHLMAEQRMARGYGPLAIQRRLLERGIDAAHADQAIEALEADWQAQAGEALQSRFGASLQQAPTQSLKARMARYLQSRGFSSRQSLRAIEQLIGSRID